LNTVRRHDCVPLPGREGTRRDGPTGAAGRRCPERCSPGAAGGDSEASIRTLITDTLGCRVVPEAAPIALFYFFATDAHMAQHPNHQGNRVALRRFFGHLACNMNYDLPVRLIDLPKEPEEFPLSSVQGFHCACGDGLGLSFPLVE